jgi:hypothetical protein
MSDTATRDTRVFYRDIKPYDAPDRLEHLQGPRSGLLDLPINVYWGPRHTFDLDNQSDVIQTYQAALREGRVIDQETLLNHELLLEIWPELMLPVRVRKLWETRFPELATDPDERYLGNHARTGKRS